VEGTILLGLDKHGPDIFERMVEFLLEIELDIAEFTVMTPFPGSPLFEQIDREGRVLSRDWSRYDAQEVVFQPAQMSPDELQRGFHHCWEAFHAEASQSVRMAKLIRRILTSRRTRPAPAAGAS